MWAYATLFLQARRYWYLMQPEVPVTPGPRYALFGLFGSPNLGNEASLAAFLAAALKRQPTARFTCIATANSRVVEMHCIESLQPMFPLPVAHRLWRLPLSVRPSVERLATALTGGERRARAARQMHSCDALFVPGTGVVDDFGQGPEDMPAHLLRWVEAACSAERPVHVVCIGVSRVDHPLSQERFVRSLDLSTSFSVRDMVSAENARRLGARHKAEVVTDLAFSLPRDWLPTREPVWPPRIIGLGLIGFRGWGVADDDGETIYQRYLLQTAQLARGLLARGFDLRLLVGDTRADAAVADDLKSVGDFPRSLASRVVAPAIGDFKDLLREIGQCDLVVAARYHNVLLALMSGRAAVSIGYADKNAAVMADMGQQAWCHDLTSFEPEAVLADLDRLTALPSPRAALLERAAQLRSRMDMHYDRLFPGPTPSQAA